MNVEFRTWWTREGNWKWKVLSWRFNLLHGISILEKDRESFPLCYHGTWPSPACRWYFKYLPPITWHLSFQSHSSSTSAVRWAFLPKYGHLRLPVVKHKIFDSYFEPWHYVYPCLFFFFLFFWFYKFILFQLQGLQNAKKQLGTYLVSHVTTYCILGLSYLPRNRWMPGIEQ